MASGESVTPSGPGPGAVTKLLSRVRAGEPGAWDEVVSLVYEDVHRLALAYMRDHAPGSILQPTALVNETYLRLLRQTAVEFQNRTHFLRIVALLMRRILVDEARQRGVAARVMEQIDRQSRAAEPPVDLAVLDDALTRLAELDSRQAQVVELRYFGGLTIEETAEFLDVSPKTVKRDWEMARTWLRAELRGRKK